MEQENWQNNTSELDAGHLMNTKVKKVIGPFKLWNKKTYDFKNAKKTRNYISWRKLMFVKRWKTMEWYKLWAEIISCCETENIQKETSKMEC